MRHLIKNAVLVVVSYSLALTTPVLARTDSTQSFNRVKNYINSSSKKKSLRKLIVMMEKDLPVSFYDNALQQTKGAQGRKWFQAAKVANNYVYFRVGDSKVFIRVTQEKDKTVFYANGIRIHENEFRNINNVSNKLILSLVAGLSGKNVSLLEMLGFKSAFAGKFQEAAPSTPVITETPITAVSGECDILAQTITSSLQQNPPDKRSAEEMCQTDQVKQCNLPANICSNMPIAVKKAGTGFFNKNNMGPIIAGVMGLAFLLIIMMRKNKRNNKKKPGEVPEPTTGVGRDPVVPGTGVNCGGEGAQCDPMPGQPTSPPTDVNVYDPNYFGETVTPTPTNTNTESTNGVGRPSVPMFKAKPKR